MAMEEKQSRLSFWYHIAASLLIIAVMFSLATYVFLKAQAGISYDIFKYMILLR